MATEQLESCNWNATKICHQQSATKSLFRGIVLRRFALLWQPRLWQLGLHSAMCSQSQPVNLASRAKESYRAALPYEIPHMAGICRHTAAWPFPHNSNHQIPTRGGEVLQLSQHQHVNKFAHAPRRLLCSSSKLGICLCFITFGRTLLGEEVSLDWWFLQSVKACTKLRVQNEFRSWKLRPLAQATYSTEPYNLWTNLFILMTIYDINCSSKYLIQNQ